MAVAAASSRMQNQKGIQLSKVSPAFLHANSTSHTWAFSAFAELIDNAYDPDVSASELLIDKLEINGHTCLIFLDNGAGMDTDKLLKMLSFGFCDKQIYERTSSHMPIGHYGNGFKSGSMRLAKDALVFTRCQNSASIGFLSQTYLKAIEADSVFIPVVTYRLPKLERIKSEQSRNILNAILKYSVFHTEKDLKEELYALEGSMTGTKIILSNLKRLQDGTLELDFSSDESDIRCPEAHEVDLTSVYHRPVQLPTSEYKHSLRTYCSILFLRPRMKITIRGMRVKSRLISKSLSNTEMDSYKPTWLTRPLKITFGFICQKTKTEDYGMMLYHRNRLIKAFEKVGYQKQPNDLGIGVVGVAQVDFLQPTHNKQDFNKDEKFNSVMMAFANKLNDYWNEKKETAPAALYQDSLRTAPDWTWAQCEMCLKWRRLPDGVDKEALPDQWFCRFNPDATHNRCEIPEEPEDEDQAVKSSYVKTFKKKREEKKRLEMYDRHRNDMEGQTLQERMRPEVVPAMNNLQRALAESKQREEEQQRLIFQMQEEKKMMTAQLAESLKPKSKRAKQMAASALQYMESSMPLSLPFKRKMDQEDLARQAKMRVTEHPTSKANKDTSRHSNNSNAIKSATSSAPLKVIIGGIINRSDKEGPKASTSSDKITNKRAVSPYKSSSDTFVDLTEELDYEITLNEDYDSDEDKKPDVNKLNAARKENEKESNGTEAVDIKPDKNALDAKHKTKEKSKASDRESPASSSETLPEIKQELHGKEANETATNKNLASTEKTISATAVNNGDDVDASAPITSLDDPEREMPLNDNTLSSNVNKVMAALENKFKKSASSQKETAETAEKESASNAEKELNVVQKDCHKDIIEIDSDEEDVDWGGVTIKKERNDGSDELQSELHKEPPSTDDADVETQPPFEVMETEPEQSCNDDVDDDDNSRGSNGASGVSTPMEGVEEDPVPHRNDSSFDRLGSNIVTPDSGSSTAKKMGDEDSVDPKDSSGAKVSESVSDSGDVDQISKNVSVHESNNDEDTSNDIRDCDHAPSAKQVDVTDVEMSETSTEVKGGEEVRGSSVVEGEANSSGKDSFDKGQLEKNNSDKDDSCTKPALNDIMNESQSVSCHASEKENENIVSEIGHSSQGKQDFSVGSKLKDDKEKETLEKDNVQNLLGAADLTDKSSVQRQDGDSMLDVKKSGTDIEENDDVSACNKSSDAMKDKLQDDCNLASTSNKNLSLVDNDNSSNRCRSSSSQEKTVEADRDSSVISKQRFQTFLSDIHHLLSLMCPDADIGDVTDIEQTVQTMIQIHLEGSQSQSTDHSAS